MKIFLYVYSLLYNLRIFDEFKLKMNNLNNNCQVLQFADKTTKEYISRWANLGWRKLFAGATHSNPFYSGTVRSIFNDPDVNEQWYFFKGNKSSSLLSHNLNDLWQQNITGKGVVIGILGGGIEVGHRDLRQNFNKTLSYNFITNSADNLYSNYDRATEKAGLIAAVSNNRQCGTGAAPSAQLVCLQIYDDEKMYLDHEMVSEAILRTFDKISIYLMHSHSYEKQSPVFITKKLFNYALRIGSKFGRLEKAGSIFITGSGDSRIGGFNCAYRSYLQRPEMFVFATISAHGSAPEYSERCTGILAAALSSDSLSQKDSLYSTTWGDLCEKTIGGTFVSASIAVGIVALLLGYSPQLSPRQIMILIVKTSEQLDNSSIRNSAGYYYSYSIGFGMLNANKLIKASKEDFIKNYLSVNTCKTYSSPRTENSFINYPKIFYVYSSGCVDSSICISEISEVYLVFTLYSSLRNFTTIFLTSPSGTRFKVLKPLSYHASMGGLDNFRIKILGYFGERPLGMWKLEVFSSSKSILKEAELIFFGICTDPRSNLLFHLKVKKYILSNYHYQTSSIYRRLLSEGRKPFNKNTSYDHYSFWETQYESVRDINNFLK